MGKRIVVLTGHYPFSHTVEFIDSEIVEMSERVQNIIILSGGRNKTLCSAIPNNVQALRISFDYHLARCLAYACCKMFSMDTYRELVYAKKVLSFSFNLKILKSLFYYYAVSKRFIIWITRNVDREDKEIILYSYWLAESAYALAVLKKKGFQFRAIARGHGGDVFLDRGYLPFRGLIYSYLNEIHFVSDAGREHFFQKTAPRDFTKKAKLFTHRLGHYKSNEIQNPQQDDDDDSIFHIVSCSSVIPLKRLDLIVDALALIQDKAIRWTHFGDGFCMKELKKMIETKLFHSNFIVSLEGQVDKDRILEFYETVPIDVFMNVSDYEGIPVSIMEAMSHGIPVIARDIGGNREIVFHKVNGLLLPPSAIPEDIAEAVQQYWAMSSTKKQIFRNNAWDTWNVYYNAQINNSKFCRHLLE